VVISDVPTCGGWKYAAEHGIATVAYPASSKTIVNGEQTGVSTEELIKALKERHQVDYVLLAGYLKVMNPPLTCAGMTA
jgi:folate-dependent phosphoribosylglycinamide formyltransferase PurN